MSPRQYIENFFEFWSVAVVRRRWVVLAGVLLCTAALVPQLWRITIDVSVESYLPVNDPALVAYNAFKAQFGNDSTAVITVETKNIFEPGVLARLRAMHDEAEQVPHTNELTSLINVRHTRADGDRLVVEDLVERWPRSEDELPGFRRMVLSNPAYVGNLISADGRYTTFILELNAFSDLNGGVPDELAFEDQDAEEPRAGEPERVTPEEEESFVTTTLRLARKYSKEGFRTFVVGIPIANYVMTRDMGRDMGMELLLALTISSLLLLVLFRRLSGLILPLLTVGLSLITTMSLFPILGWPVTGNTQIMPTFLLAVGITAPIHILTMFYARYDSGYGKNAAIIYSLKHTAFAVVMTSLTTAAGLVSFASADLMPVVGMGLFGAIGVVLALIYTNALVPALLAIFPIRRQAKREPRGGGKGGFLFRVDRGIAAVGGLAARRPRSVLTVAGAITVLSGIGLTWVEFSHDPLRWYPKDNPVRVASELFDREMSGTQTLEILFDSGKDSGLYDPRFMTAMEEMEAFIARHRIKQVQAKKQNSILAVLREIHKALNGGKDEFYRVPDTRAAIAQELLLFESSGSDDLENFTDSAFRVSRATVVMPWTNVIDYDEFISTLQHGLRDIAASHGYAPASVQVTGLIPLFARTVQAILSTMMKSYVLAFIFVFVLMVMVMGSLRGGLISLIPNLLPIFVTLGLIGWLGTPLNMLTTLIGCIIIGIAVDDTIHFMHHFRKFAVETGDTVLATRLTLEHVGRALLFTSVVLCGGFLVFLSATFSAQRDFGVLLGFAIAVALLADFMVSPALMVLFWKNPSQVAATVAKGGHSHFPS